MRSEVNRVRHVRDSAAATSPRWGADPRSTCCDPEDDHDRSQGLRDGSVNLIPRGSIRKIRTQKAKKRALKVYQTTRKVSGFSSGTPDSPIAAHMSPKRLNGSADSIRIATTPV